jgi:hypothetical protein
MPDMLPLGEAMPVGLVSEVLFARSRALVPASYPIAVVLLFGFVFDHIDRFARHVAGVVVILARFLFARLLRFGFLGITHHCTFLFV